jgi:hypothetical protein
MLQSLRGCFPFPREPGRLPSPPASGSGSGSKTKWSMWFKLDLELVHPDTASKGNGFGAAMSSSPWEQLGNGDEDVASPFHAGVGSR